MVSAPDTLSMAFQYHRAGHLAQAEQMYRQVLHTNPRCAEALHLLGLLAHQQGHHQLALDNIEQAIAADAANPVYHSSRGMVARQLGRLDEAAGSYAQAVRLNPAEVDDRASLALLLAQLGQFDDAALHFRRVVQQQPDNVEARYNLGVVLGKLGNLAEARTCFEHVISQAPNNAEAHNNLGVIFDRLGQLDAAITHFHHTLRLQPHNAEAYNNLGVALGKQGLNDDAVTCFQEAVRLNPNYVDAWYNLGNRLHILERFTNAIAAFEQVLRLQPNHAGAQNNLGVVHLTLGNIEAADTAFRTSLQVQPADAEAHYNLGVILARQDKLDDALAHYHRSLKLRPDKLRQLEMETLCPAIMASNAEIDRWRAKIEAALDCYPAGAFNLNHWLDRLSASNAQPPFYLHYQGRNDRPIKEKFARLFAAPAPRSGTHHRPNAGAHHIGFFVSRRNESLFVSLMGGIINHLTSPDLKLTIICPAAGVDLIRPYIKNRRVHYLPVAGSLSQVIEQIATARLDLLYYWEVGSRAANYFLPFFRLAPVQVTSWGVLSTTGLPQMDYYISSTLFEPPNAEDFYTEMLVQLPTPLAYAYRPQLPTPLKDRAQLGLPEDAHLYFCPQNRLKFHPDFDALLAGVLRRDPRGQVLLITRTDQRFLDALFLHRFEQAHADVIDRIKILPQQNYPTYLNLVAAADVLLDTVHFGGGITTYDGLALGTPIVTLPANFMRGRMALGCYNYIGVLDGVANTPDDYVGIAVRLGTEPDYRAHVSRVIRAANGQLFEDERVVRETERFFRAAIDRAAAG